MLYMQLPRAQGSGFHLPEELTGSGREGKGGLEVS